MPRFDFKFWLITILMVGGIFETIKRLHSPFSPAPQELTAKTLKEEILPYSRKQNIQALHFDQESPFQKRQRLRKSMTTATTSLAKVQIPPPSKDKEGSFENHVPPSVTQATDPDAHVKKDKAAQDKKKTSSIAHCKPRKPRSADENSPLSVTELQKIEPRKENLTADSSKEDSSPQKKEDLPAESSSSNEVKTAETNSSEEALEECPEEQPVAAEKKTSEAPPQEPSTSENNHDALVGFGPKAVGVGLPVSTDDDKDLEGLEEWKARLLSTPNFKETLRLIEAVQSGQISTTLFYALVELMLNDSREKIQEYGILAAGRYPSTESFHLLVGVLKRTGYGSHLRVRAENELATYEQLGHLSVLADVMRTSSDTFEIIWATRQVEDSAKKFLNPKFNQPGNSTGKHPYAQFYQKFLSLLQDISSQKNSPEAQQAQQTLQNLKNLLAV